MAPGTRSIIIWFIFIYEISCNTNAEYISQSLVKDQLGRGQSLSDQLAVEVVAWRVGLADVIEKGCVLDGFPKSASQAMALANRNLLPTLYFM